MKMERSTVLNYLSLFKPQFQISRFSTISSSSSTSESRSPFIVDYLIQAFGISRERALRASKRLLHLKTPKKPDSVLQFLRSIGLSQSQLSDTILRRPPILTSNVHKNLQPKIDLFKSLGASEKEIPDLVACSAVCLGNSVDRRLLPAVNFLREILKDDKKIRDALKRCPWILTNDPQKIPLRNLEFLRKKGLDESSISSLVYKSPSLLVCKLDQLISACKVVEEELELSSEDVYFADALHVVTAMSKENLSRKLKILRSFGFEKSSLYLLFRWSPVFFRSKDEYMKKKLDFFLNEVGFDHESLLKHSFQIGLSLEGRLMPRYKLIRGLQSKGLVPNECDFSKVFFMTEEGFMHEYVNKFRHEVESDLLEAYKEFQEG